MMQAQDAEFTSAMVADTLALRAQSILAAQDAALPFYPNDDGTLTVFLNLATYAGAGWAQKTCVIDPKETAIPLSASYEFATAELTEDGAVTVTFHEDGVEFSGRDYQNIYGFAFDTPYTVRGCFGSYTTSLSATSVRALSRICFCKRRTGRWNTSICSAACGMKRMSAADRSTAFPV